MRFGKSRYIHSIIGLLVSVQGHREVASPLYHLTKCVARA
jgi:hypothetical protein